MAGDTQGRAIFISYRRDDSEGEAGRLYDDLVRAYGDKSVFMDVSGIEPGLDFRKAIDANVATCGVLLAMIGPTWVSVTDSSGNRRLENANDFVRLEIASALARGVPVVPVLVHAAKMPPLDQLPDDLKDLRYRNSVELTHARWNSDVELLVTALKSYVAVNTSRETEPVHATIPAQLPAPSSPQLPVTQSSSKSKIPLLVAILAAAIVVIAMFVILTRPQRHDGSISQGSSSVPQGASSSATKQALPGRWKIVEEPKGSDDLSQIEIVDSEGELTIQAWGKCSPQPCEWGKKKATMDGAEAVTEPWELRNSPGEIKTQRTADLTVRTSARGLLVLVHNTFHEPNGSIVENRHPLEFTRF